MHIRLVLDKMNCGRHLTWLISLNGISLMILVTSIVVDCQNGRVEVGNVCLEVGYNALIDCQYEIRDGETLVRLTWGRSNTDGTSFPIDNVLASYHFTRGKHIPDEYIGHVDLANDTFALMIQDVTEADIQESRYWCQATILGTVYFDHEDLPSSGIRRATPSISETSCEVKDGVHSCNSGDTLTCSANDFTPDANFELTWSCETDIGTAKRRLPELDPDDSMFDAVNVFSLKESTKSVENVKCNCTARGSSNCNSGVLSKEVTITVKGQRRSLTTGALIGIIVGIVVLLFACVGGAVRVYMKSQKSKGRVAETDEEKQSKEKDSLQESKDSESHTEQEDETTLDKN